MARYFLVWCLLAIVAIANGFVRHNTYGKVLSDLAAHQVSTVTAIIAFGIVVWLAHRAWPIPSASQAIAIGGCWLLMTVVFEFGFGHFVAGDSWAKLFADYNLLEGRVWSLVLIWVTVLPFVVVRLSSRIV